MTIKEAAEKTGLSADTLRYYERIGLIPPVPRKASGVRDYTEDSLNWIQFALCIKKAGVSLEDIIEYIQLAKLGDTTKNARREIIVQAKRNAERKIAELKEVLKYADYKLDHYYSDIVPITEKLVNFKIQHEQAV